MPNTKAMQAVTAVIDASWLDMARQCVTSGRAEWDSRESPGNQFVYVYGPNAGLWFKFALAISPEPGDHVFAEFPGVGAIVAVDRASKTDKEKEMPSEDMKAAEHSSEAAAAIDWRGDLTHADKISDAMQELSAILKRAAMSIEDHMRTLSEALTVEDWMIERAKVDESTQAGVDQQGTQRLDMLNRMAFLNSGCTLKEWWDLSEHTRQVYRNDVVPIMDGPVRELVAELFALPYDEHVKRVNQLWPDDDEIVDAAIVDE